MILFVNVLFVLYLLMILFFLIGWFSNNFKESKKKNRLSVVIAVRNEQDNIGFLIEDLKLQDYDKHLFDVIIVDDHSIHPVYIKKKYLVLMKKITKIITVFFQSEKKINGRRC